MHKKRNSLADQEGKLFNIKDKAEEASYDVVDFNQVVVDMLKQSSAPSV